jgi:hypothetical protein
MRRDSRRLPNAFSLLVPLLLVANVPAFAADAKAGAAQEPQKFLRFVEEGRDGGRLETAIATYQNAQGQKVHLVAAVHIADTGYFAALNKLFDGYDALLYEMVKPKDMGAPERVEANGISVVHIIQKGLKTFLDLDYQLDGIDYTKKNFVHADLTAEEFNRMQDERGESLFGLMMQQMMREMMKGGGGNAQRMQDMDPMQLLAALSSDDGARQLKMILAKQFENMDEMVAALEGPDGSVLLTERNKAAMKVVKEQLAAGKKNMGLFYGAAHMKDLEKRLMDELGFRRTGVEWRVAWDLAPRGGRAAANNGAGRGGQVGRDERDERDETIKKLLEKIESLEKRLDDVEKKK